MPILGRSTGRSAAIRRGRSTTARTGGHGSDMPSNPRQFLTERRPDVWQGPTACSKTGGDTLSPRASTRGFGLNRITLDEPRHVDVNGDNAYVLAAATMRYSTCAGKQVTQTGSAVHGRAPQSRRRLASHRLGVAQPPLSPSWRGLGGLGNGYVALRHDVLQIWIRSEPKSESAGQSGMANADPGSVLNGSEADPWAS